MTGGSGYIFLQRIKKTAAIAVVTVAVTIFFGQPTYAENVKKAAVTVEPAAIEADTPARTRLNKSTLKKGFTLETGLQQFRIGVTPNSLGKRKSVRIALKPVTTDEVDLSGQTLLSGLYSFDIYHKKTVEVFKPIWLSLAWTTPTQTDYVLKYWHGERNEWIAIPATADESEQRMEAAIHIPYAIVGVFAADTKTYTGKASWYDWHGAAMNEPPMGSDVLVTNTENGKQVRVTIVSRGPYIPGRIIDLPREAFAALDNVSRGVISVEVKEIKTTEE